MKNKITITLNILLILCCLLTSACSEKLIYDVQEVSAPVITSFSPKSGGIGTLITIKGENLSKVNKATLGGQGIEIFNRISPTEMIVMVTETAQSGKITISNEKGTAESSDSFEITFDSPVITNFPATSKANSEIVIEGQRLDVVQKVMFGSTEGKIVSKVDKELIVEVPFFEEPAVAIKLSYFNGTTMAQVSTANDAFELEKPQPSVTNAPTTAKISTTIVVTGTNLDIITEAWFGKYKGMIDSKSPTSLSITVPADFTASENVIFKLIYYGTKEFVVNNAFAVVVPAPSLINYWENKTIYCQDPSYTQNFFNAETGAIYGPCDYATKKNDITFFVTISNAQLQLNNPNNSANQTKNFKCNGVALPTEVMPNVVKFKTLKTTIVAENELIQKVKNKTLVSISQDDIVAAGIANAGTSTPKFNDPAGFVIGDVLMFQYFSGATVVKVGFIEIVDVNFLPVPDANKSNITFNCYYQK